MDKTYFENLKSENTSEIANKLSNALKLTDSSNELQAKTIALAFVLKEIQSYNNKISPKEFFEHNNLPCDVSDILYRYTKDIWHIIEEYYGVFNNEMLSAFILFDNSLEEIKNSDCITPLGVSRLACKILNCKKGEKVLELCSGKGNFAVEQFEYCSEVDYTGVELNYIANDIAVLRTTLLRVDYKFELNDVFEFRCKEKADKIFANYPFMVRSVSANEYKNSIQNIFGIDKDIVKKTSSDWLFNAIIIEQMNEAGKAVAIMTNGSTWNNTDKGIRKFFVENGYIEAVIALPSKLFNNTAMATTMIVFSNNNASIKLIDARNICEVGRKINTLTIKNIETIIDLLSKDTDLSVTKTIDEIAENEYVLNAVRYLEVTPEVKNGVEFGSVIKNITRGSQLKATEFDDLKSTEPTQYRYLMLSNINNGIIDFEEDEQYLSALPPKSDKYCIKNNSIVLSKIGIPTFKSAVAIVDDDKKIIANGNLFVIELDEDKVNPFYIQAFFSSEAGVAMFRNIYTGAHLPTISLDKLRKMIVPLPDINEQKAIGNKYAAAMDEFILTKRRLQKITSKMKHIFDEEV